MPVIQDRRAFLKAVMGAAGTGLAVQLLAACSPSGAPSATQAPAPASGGQTAPAQTTAMTKVSYAFASVNPYHWVAVVANEKPELPGKFGIQFDPLTTNNSANAMTASASG